jgi:CpeT protein
MMRKKHACMLTAMIASCLLAAACNGDPHRATSPPAPDDLTILKNWMVGSFSSEVQAQEDPAFSHIVLHMRQIWDVDPDGFWLYVEQAAAESEDKPYRQRIYRLSVWEDDTLASEVYEIPDPLRFAGAWKNPDVLGVLDRKDLIPRTGCIILLKKEGEEFRGSTHGRDCLSSLRGASYAVSEAVIRPDELLTWDRGFDASGRFVWGSETGPYHFRRMDNR